MLVDLKFDYEAVTESLDKFNQKDIDELRQWTLELDGSKCVPKNLTEKQFLVFYSACYADLYKTKTCIENYYNHRKNAPELFNHRIMRSEGIKLASKIAEFILLPNKSNEGHDVLFHRLHDTDASNFDLDSVCKLLFKVVDLCLSKRGSQSGLVFIFDMRGVSFGHVTSIKLSTLRTLFPYVQEALPVRMKAIHVLNAEFVMEKVMLLIKPFMDKKFFGMIKLHNKNENLESLYKVVSRTNLPSDYGGSLANTQMLHKELMKELGLHGPYFKAEEEQRMAACSDKTADKTLIGTFKKLDID